MVVYTLVLEESLEEIYSDFVTGDLPRGIRKSVIVVYRDLFSINNQERNYRVNG